MSGFIFGTITLIKDYSEKELNDISWKIFRLGDRYNLYFMFDPSIPHESICEMLDKQIKEKDCHFRYLLTVSPINNTTDNFVLPVENTDEYGKAIMKNMSSLASLIKSIVKMEEVKNMVVIIVEGYDIEFKRIKTNSKGINEALIQEIDEYAEMPSVMFEVEE